MNITGHFALAIYWFLLILAFSATWIHGHIHAQRKIRGLPKASTTVKFTEAPRVLTPLDDPMGSTVELIKWAEERALPEDQRQIKADISLAAARVAAGIQAQNEQNERMRSGNTPLHAKLMEHGIDLNIVKRGKHNYDTYIEGVGRIQAASPESLKRACQAVLERRDSRVEGGWLILPDDAPEYTPLLGFTWCAGCQKQVDYADWQRHQYHDPRQVPNFGHYELMAEDQRPGMTPYLEDKMKHLGFEPEERHLQRAELVREIDGLDNRIDALSNMLHNTLWESQGSPRKASIEEQLDNLRARHYKLEEMLDELIIGGGT